MENKPSWTLRAGRMSSSTAPELPSVPSPPTTWSLPGKYLPHMNQELPESRGGVYLPSVCPHPAPSTSLALRDHLLVEMNKQCIQGLG